MLDGFHQGRGFSGSRRSVNNGYILPKVPRLLPFPGGLEPRELHRLKENLSASDANRISREISQAVVLRLITLSRARTSACSWFHQRIAARR